MDKNTSIDNISCYLFDKINESGNTYLLVGEKTSYLLELWRRFKGVNHVKQWERINDEFINAFGIGEVMEKYLDKMKEYVTFLDQAINKGQPAQINFANIAKLEAEEILGSNKLMMSEPIDKYSAVSKYLGFPVRPKETTVKELYNYLRLINEENKRLKTQYDGNRD